MTDLRLKIWLNLLKWTIGTGSIIWVTTIINAGLNDRKTGLDELKQYDRYVQLIIENNKVGERRLLAQYFSKVTVSEPLRKRWEDYYKVVSYEYDSLIRKDLVLQHKDSIYTALIFLKDSLNEEHLRSIEEIKQQREYIETQIKLSPLKMQYNSDNMGVIKKLYESQMRYDSLLEQYVTLENRVRTYVAIINRMSEKNPILKETLKAFEKK